MQGTVSRSECRERFQETNAGNGFKKRVQKKIAIKRFFEKNAKYFSEESFLFFSFNQLKEKRLCL